MADIAATPFINYGLSQAQQMDAQASAGLKTQQAGLVNQQAQQAAMDTAVQRRTMPYVMSAIDALTADQSGANAGNPNAGNGRPGGPPAGGVGADASGEDPTLYNATSLEDTLRNQNYVAPVTQREQQMLQLGTALSMSPKTAAQGAALIERMKTERELRMSTATAQNQNTMGNAYDAASSVATIDPDLTTPGRTFGLLQQVDKRDAAAIAKIARNPDGTLNQEMADRLAQQYAKHLAGVSFLYSGRPHEMKNGQMIDTNAGKKVVGIDQVLTGATDEMKQKEYDHWNDDFKWTTPDNVEHHAPRWQAPHEYGGHDGKMTPAQSVLAMDQAMRQAANPPPGGSPGAPSPPTPAVGEAARGATSAPGAPLNGAQGLAVSRANQARNDQRAAMQANLKPKTTNGQDQGTLPGVDLNQAPNMVDPGTRQGPGTPGTITGGLQKGKTDRANAAIEATQQTYGDNVKMDSLIQRARADINELKSSPRMVGPGSSLDIATRNFYTFLTGQAPNASVSEVELDKFLNQIGANNVRQLLAGQRITNQEMMTFLTRGSPSTSMPLRAIEGLVNYLDADNQYSMRYNKSLITALSNGKDPDLTPGYLSQAVPRADYVTRRLNGAPQLSAGSNEQAHHPDTTEEAYNKLKDGDTFYWKGEPHKKGENR